MNEYSRILAKFVVNLQYENIPKEVIEKTKMHFLDTIGVTLGAYEMPWSQIVINLVKQVKGKQQSTVLSEIGKYPMIMAALANGTMAHGIDMDDSGARPSWAHPGACIVPAAFAAAEAERVNGKALILSILAGYEVNCRVDTSVYPGLRNRGFHATGVIGALGAAAAAGKIFGLNEEQMINAFGLAGTQASGLEEWLIAGDMSKRLHAGKAAMNGILSALLAREDYTGPSTVFEGKYGLLSTHSSSYDLSRLTENLGTEFKILGCKFKPYACCHELCGPIRLVKQAKKENDIKLEDIKKIRIGLNHITAENQLKVAETSLHAQNHAAIAVAIAFVQEQIFLKEFFDCYKDPRVIELGQKCDVYIDPEIDKNFPNKIGTRLEILTKDKTYSLYEGDKPPISYNFIREKFSHLVSSRISNENSKNVIQSIEKLEFIDNIDQISELFMSNIIH
jgi:2-methylcitrate dehydratase PrpD